jgi:Arc/MetJ-type ribon-helix-helix transcriptional regulator
MSADEAGSGKTRRVRRSENASAPAELSALEQTLRQALETVPRDQVVKCIVSVLPATVFVEESGRLHGGKVRKVSVSMPEELADAVRARTGSGGFSRYVTDAVEEQVRLNLLDELSEKLQAEFGPFDEEGVRQAMRLWTEEEP